MCPQVTSILSIEQCHDFATLLKRIGVELGRLSDTQYAKELFRVNFQVKPDSAPNNMCSYRNLTITSNTYRIWG